MEEESFHAFIKFCCRVDLFVVRATCVVQGTHSRRIFGAESLNFLKSKKEKLANWRDMSASEVAKNLDCRVSVDSEQPVAASFCYGDGFFTFCDRNQESELDTKKPSATTDAEYLEGMAFVNRAREGWERSFDPADRPVGSRRSLAMSYFSMDKTKRSEALNGELAYHKQFWTLMKSMTPEAKSEQCASLKKNLALFEETGRKWRAEFGAQFQNTHTTSRFSLKTRAS